MLEYQTAIKQNYHNVEETLKKIFNLRKNKTRKLTINHKGTRMVKDRED